MKPPEAYTLHIIKCDGSQFKPIDDRDDKNEDRNKK